MYSYSYMQTCIKFSVIQQSIEPINYGYMDYEYGIKKIAIGGRGRVGPRLLVLVG